MNIASCALLGLCMTSLALSAHGEAEAASHASIASPEAALQLLTQSHITTQNALSDEMQLHMAAVQKGDEGINDYPYIDTALQLYKEASASDRATSLTLALKALAAAGCQVRDLAQCCCAATAQAPNNELLECVLTLNSHPTPETLNKAGTDGLTPLLVAVQHGVNPEIIRSLIENGADVNAKTKREWTPLMFAASSGNAAIAKLLISHKAELEEAETHGMTALHLAAVGMHPEICRLLAESGADINAKSYNGDTALYLGVEAARDKVTDDTRRLIDTLLQAGADPKAANFNEWTPLMISARNGNMELSRRLIQAGSEVNARDVCGMTALFFAAGNNRPEMCRLLIAHGADVNMGDNGERTPLMFAVAAEAKEVCRLLLSAGAKADAKASNGATAKDMARSPEIIAILEN